MCLPVLEQSAEERRPLEPAFQSRRRPREAVARKQDPRSRRQAGEDRSEIGKADTNKPSRDVEHSSQAGFEFRVRLFLVAGFRWLLSVTRVQLGSHFCWSRASALRVLLP